MEVVMASVNLAWMDSDLRVGLTVFKALEIAREKTLDIFTMTPKISHVERTAELPLLLGNFSLNDGMVFTNGMM